MSTTKIEVFKLDIDIEAAVKSTVTMKNETDALKTKFDELKKSESASTEEIVRAKGAYDAANTNYKVAQREIEKLTSLQNKDIKTVGEARTALSVVSSQWAKQAKLYGENSTQVEALSKKKLQLTERLKTLEGQTGDNTRNVGNYTGSMKAAIQSSGLFGQAQGALNAAVKTGGPIIAFMSTNVKAVKKEYAASTANTIGFSKAQIAANVTSSALTAGLKLLKIALAATGIGLLVVALGSLIAFFSKTQAGIDAVNKITAVLGATFDVIIDRAAAIGSGLSKIFSGDIKGGLSELKEGFKGVGDEIAREVGLVKELEDARNRLRKEELGLIVTQEKRKKQIEEFRFQAKDELSDLKDRAAALTEAGKLEEKILADQLKVAKEKARISQLDTDRANSTDEELKANEEVQAAVIALETESLKKRRSIEAEKQGLLKRDRAQQATAAKEAETRNKASIDAAIKDSKTRLDLFVAQNQGKAKSLQDALAFEEDFRDKRLQILEEEKAAGKKTAAEYELDKYKIKTEFLDAQAVATVEYAEKEFKTFKDANQSRLEAGQLLTDQLVDQEQERLDRIAQAERDAAQKKLESGAIDQEKYNSVIDAINEENRLGKEAKQTELDQQQAEKKAIDFENEVAIQAENFLASQELKSQELEAQRFAEVESAKKTGADIALINEKYAAQQAQIEQQKKEFKIDTASATFGSLSEILGKESAAGKAAAIAQTTIDTYKSATAAYSALAGIPVVGPALGAIAAGAAVAAGLKTVQKIVSTKKPDIPKGAKGLTMTGRSHSQGGEGLFDRFGNQLAEIEGGENLYVVNKRASGLINSLSNINQSTGGIPLTKNTTYAAAGGAISRSVNGSGSAINYDALAEKLAGAYSSLPAPQVAVTDIRKQNTNYQNLVDVANF